MKELEPTTLVIFGAAGNLARRKLIPALFQLESLGRLPASLTFLGLSLEEENQDSWRARIQKLFPQEKDPLIERFLARWHYQRIDPSDSASYQALQTTLKDEGVFPTNHVFYMAVRR